MPSDGYFGFTVLIAGRPIPEYLHDGRVYVESNLSTPFSFNQQLEEVVDGEKEVQNCPVTPYQLFIQLAPHCDTSVVFVYVDGVRVTKLLLEKGQSKIVKGFEDKEGIREFLFALPRFAVDKSDRLDKKRQSRIGTIEITRCDASYVKEEYREVKGVEFHQATKKDAYKVTEGKYTMSTTKKGRYIHRSTPYDVQLKKLWRVGPESSRLTIHYRMGHTLQDMGLELKPIDWSRVIVRRRSSSGSGSTPPTTPPISPGGQISKNTVAGGSRSSSPKPTERSNMERLHSPTTSAGNEEGSTHNQSDAVASSSSPRVVESRELNLDYSTTKIKQEPKDVAQSITHIQIVAAS